MASVTLNGRGKGFIKVHSLHHAAEEPVYGLAMIEELRRQGYVLSPGTPGAQELLDHGAGLTALNEAALAFASWWTKGWRIGMTMDLAAAGHLAFCAAESPYPAGRAR